MMVILRSMLFVPANNWRMILRAIKEREDAVILDLEDAVPLGEKETGRIFARDSLPMFKERNIVTYVRVNSLETGFTAEDLNYITNKDLTGVMLPKSGSVEDILQLENIIEEEEERKGLSTGNISIIPLLETPKGVAKANEIAVASKRVKALSFGAGDFLRELGGGFATTQLSPEEYFPMLLYARSHISIAAKSAGIPAIDTPFFGLLLDMKGLRTETEKAKLLGFSGKLLIHPRQIDPVNEVFSPSPEDIEYAKNIIAAYKEAEAKGLGAASFGGRMIDYAMFAMGEALLEKAEMISEKEKRQVVSETSNIIE
ncbi:MAG: HpcH/HpaI aldolase/citrate lyase family protein [Candidatus Hodarchaeota archaeon]